MHIMLLIEFHINSIDLTHWKMKWYTEYNRMKDLAPLFSMCIFCPRVFSSLSSQRSAECMVVLYFIQTFCFTQLTFYFIFTLHLLPPCEKFREFYTTNIFFFYSSYVFPFFFFNVFYQFQVVWCLLSWNSENTFINLVITLLQMVQ